MELADLQNVKTQWGSTKSVKMAESYITDNLPLKHARDLKLAAELTQKGLVSTYWSCSTDYDN